MEPIYVTGHRNPDTDSIVSAMAYAALENALGRREYVASRLGPVSDETQLVLDKFGFEPPMRIHNVRNQVRDLDFDTPPALSADVTVGRAWNLLREDKSIPALPVTDETGGLYGLLTPGMVAEFDMDTIQRPVLTDVSVYNLLSVLEGRILRDGGQNDTVSGEVVLALPKAHGAPVFPGKDCVLLCGQQDDIIRAAISAGVRLIVLCQAELKKDLMNLPGDTCVISTPQDACRASRLIYQAIPIRRICFTENPVYFHLDDYIDEVRETVLKNRFRAYPVLDENEKVVGMLSRFHLLRPRRKKVVLMDHNESAQSVPGLEQAEIVRIIDHHRLADIETGAPVYFRNEPVGSTATIVAEMFQEKGLMPSPAMAGLLASAILSDTVMFKSPTCTAKDVNIAERMARIAGISPEELGKAIFAASYGDSKSAQDLLFTDFKEFHIAGHALGIGQVTCMDSGRIMERKDELLALMEKTADERHYDYMMLMLTDILRDGTRLLFIGDEDALRQAFGAEIKDGSCFLPHILSRKKQVVPMLSVLWG